ncbi:MAG: hypothetical protein AAGC46_09430 [Solirubrobacteraceae bacterium]|nr:hypothetical protein [Patulibacter sp.]
MSRATHRATRARRAPLLAAVVVALGLPAAATAHGGYQMVAATKGPYSVTVRARPFMDGQTSKIDVTSYVVRQDIGESDLNAKLELQLKGPHGTLRFSPPVVGDGYEEIVADPKNEWRYWTVTARVSGAAGETIITGGPVGAPPGAPTWLIPASAVVIVVAGGFYVAGRRRRAAGTDDDAGDDDEVWLDAPA